MLIFCIIIRGYAFTGYMGLEMLKNRVNHIPMEQSCIIYVVYSAGNSVLCKGRKRKKRLGRALGYTP